MKKDNKYELILKLISALDSVKLDCYTLAETELEQSIILCKKIKKRGV